MKALRLRSQLLIAALLIILGLTGSLLLFIRHAVTVEIQKQVRDGTEESVHAFESVQRQRELQLSRTAAMLAELPTLKMLMSTEHALTIQDGSRTFWKLAGSDLFVLAKPDREVVSRHSGTRSQTFHGSGGGPFLVVRRRPPLLGILTPYHFGGRRHHPATGHSGSGLSD